MKLSKDELRRRDKVRTLRACALPEQQIDGALERILARTLIGTFLETAAELERDGLLIDWCTTPAGQLYLDAAAPFTREVAA